MSAYFLVYSVTSQQNVSSADQRTYI